MTQSSQLTADPPNPPPRRRRPRWRRLVNRLARRHLVVEEPQKFPDEESEALFLAEDRELTCRNVSILCVIAIILVPLAGVLDYFAYPDQVGTFIALRLLCAAILLGVLYCVRSKVALRYYRAYTVIVPMIPAFFISLMIYLTGDPGSSYYAGLTLCLVAIGFMFHWTYREGLLATLIVLTFYALATLPALAGGTLPSSSVSTTINNFIFIFLNGVVIVSGSYFHHRIRLREFISRLELDRSRSELESSNQQLREVDQLKTDFLANVSHELRTPLTLLLAPLQSLRHHKVLSPNQAVMIDNMHQQALRLLKLINDLLDIAKLESGQLELGYEAISIREFVNEITESISELANQRSITITAHCAENVTAIEADRDKLEKICLNLLFNAIKFTPEYGRIHLGVRTEGEEVIFTIKDTGVGIPPERLPYVFERFWQEDSSAKKKHAGTGIGLALVKELTEAMGGAVMAESVPNRGTSMIVRLPALNPAATHLHDDSSWLNANQPSKLRPPTSVRDRSEVSQSMDWLSQLYREAEFSPAQTNPVAVEESNELSDLVSVSANPDHPSHTIVVADDEAGMRAFLAGELVHHYQIVEAYNGADTIRKVNEWEPDLILLDYMMPEMDGLEVCRALRSQARTRMIPIMLLTAKADEQTRLAGLEAGANDVLIKPFSLVEFHTRIRNLLTSHTLQKNLEAQKKQVEETLDQLRETESQLVQSEKLAAVGQLSAGILHEINNPLHFSISALFTLSKKLRQLPEQNATEFRETIADLKDGLNRVSTIVSDLRDFTHPDTGKRTRVSLAEVLSVTQRLLAQRIREDNISVHERGSADTFLLGNKNRLIQVFVNIVQNACDALRDTPVKVIDITTEHDDQHAFVSVRDNGQGVAPENLNKLFDPFFTTKEIGDGTGLGLSICYRLVKEHGGHIDVESRLGAYTTFTLRLPLDVTAESPAESDRQREFAGAYAN